MTRRRIPTLIKVLAGSLAAVVAIGVLVAIGMVGSTGTRGSEASAGASPTTSPATLRVVIDEALQPRVATVAGFNDGDPARSVGRVDDDGVVSDLVLDEVQLIVSDEAALDAFVERWGGTVVDVSDPDTDGTRTALVRVDVSRADPALLPSDLQRIEPDHTGTLALSSKAVARLYALIAHDAAKHGTIAAPNTLDENDAIADRSTREWIGFVTEKKPTNDNSFNWNYLRDGGALDTGVSTAWQLLEAAKGFDRRVSIMVVDGGFVANPDFPGAFQNPGHSKIRQASWGQANRMDCGDHACPWHGSDVAMAALALPGNEWGTAGPAGPVADLVAVGAYEDGYKTLRRTLDMVREYHPDVVNMSFGSDHKAFRDTTEVLKDWYFRRMADTGALLVAAAGNDGTDVDARTCGSSSCDEAVTWLPCESAYVLCVGGLDRSTAAWDEGSNYGTVDDSRSVEIYGPYCTHGKVNHEETFDPAIETVCGTSFSSPFVAGVAGLVKSANPDLTAGQIAQLLAETAHSGMPLADRTRVGSSRWVDAFEAARRALDVDVKPPTIQIDTPFPAEQFGIEEWVDLRAHARDFLGRDLDITWTDDVDGSLGTTKSNGLTSAPLAPGPHKITATATDLFGAQSSATIGIELVDTPPSVNIVSPAPGTKRNTTDVLTFAAQTHDPDTFSPVADTDVSWTVKRAGTSTVVWTGKGHEHEIGASFFGAGSFDVTVDATDGSGAGTATSSFTLIAIPQGESAPSVKVTKPAMSLELYAHNGAAQAVQFSGEAFDAQEGWLPGTRFKWIARSGHGPDKVLCVGTSVPGQGANSGGGLAVPKSCASFTSQLGLDGFGNSTTWTVTLEATDSKGYTGYSSRIVKISYITG